MSKLAKIATVVAVAVAGVGCGSQAGADEPKPKGWQIIRYPQGNGECCAKLATFCDHGNRIYVTQDGSYDRLAVAANDPSCAETPS